jgi:hypothetical protein
LVPQVLAALAALGYPDAKLIKVKQMIGTKERAGWSVATREVGYYDSTTGVNCYLLSTGDFNYGGNGNPSQRAADIVQVPPQDIEAGLQRLLEKYGL